jgi:hypothetical protein
VITYYYTDLDGNPFSIPIITAINPITSLNAFYIESSDINIIASYGIRFYGDVLEGGVLIDEKFHDLTLTIIFVDCNTLAIFPSLVSNIDYYIGSGPLVINITPFALSLA